MLLRVAQAFEKLARESAFEHIHAMPKIDNVRHNQFGGGAGSRRPQISNEIANREIDFVADRGNDRDSDIDNRSRDDLLVELPQIFDAAAAARDND